MLFIPTSLVGKKRAWQCMSKGGGLITKRQNVITHSRAKALVNCSFLPSQNPNTKHIHNQKMARLSSANPPAAIDPTAVNLSRLLVRLQQNLNSPDPDVESKLRSSSLERERVGQVWTSCTIRSKMRKLLIITLADRILNMRANSSSN